MVEDKVSCNYRDTSNGVSTWYLRSAHKVSKCGKNSCHIYVPKELEGREIIGVLVKDEHT